MLFDEIRTRTLWLWGPNPKCLTASRAFLGPRRSRVFAPVGARRASWSRVKVSPPAFSIRARAVAVKRRAATDNFGTVKRRLSSVTVPITTTVLPLCDSLTFEAIRERETGGRLILDIKRRRRTALLKLDSVRPVKYTKSASVTDVCCVWIGRHTRQETVQLHQDLQVDILALGSLAVGAAYMVTVQVDT